MKLKRLVSMLLAFSMMLMLLPAGAVSAFAAEPDTTAVYTDGDYKFTVNDDGTTATITGYTGAGGDIVIPDTVKNENGTYDVTVIGNHAFNKSMSPTGVTLTGVTLPSTLVTIGTFSFFGNQSLSNVDFSKCANLKTIGGGSFANCFNSDGGQQTKVDFSACKNLETISEGAFRSCRNITEMNFSGCTALKELKTSALAGTGVTEFDFSTCTNLTTIGSAFTDCEKLQKIILPSSVTSMDTSSSAFANCPASPKIIYNGTRKQWDTVKGDTTMDSSTECRADLTVKGGTITDVVKDGVSIKNDVLKQSNTSANIPEGASVTVAFDGSALKDSGSNFDQWKFTAESGDKDALLAHYKESTFTFTMPGDDVTMEAMTKDATIEDDSSEALGIAAAAATGVVGTAVLAYQGYMLGSELYLTYLLPAGAAIPNNRAELAKLLWQDAGEPAPAAQAVYSDIDVNDTKTQQAAQWAVENQLMALPDESKPDTFAPDASVSYAEVIKTWKKAQELKNN